mmetsp:Transcript_16574/g.19932  ORF Transcript_16574/g.19932 Transcript_16574/m.19932 type:complete len:226 (+) Transcript_16574:27-704(+)|eukprot:jgi/Bigna1/86154/estExt_fgenesh1_pg.C_80196
MTYQWWSKLGLLLLVIGVVEPHQRYEFSGESSQVEGEANIDATEQPTHVQNVFGEVCTFERVFTNESITSYSTEVMDVTESDPPQIIKEYMDKYVVVFIYAAWCPFSAKALPIFKELANSFPRNDIEFIKVDGEVNKKFLAQHLIRGYPSISVYEKGKVTSVFEDGKKTLENLIKYVENSTGVKPRKVIFRQYEAVVPPKDSYNLLLAFTTAYVVGTACMWCGTA